MVIERIMQLPLDVQEDLMSFIMSGREIINSNALSTRNFASGMETTSVASHTPTFHSENQGSHTPVGPIRISETPVGPIRGARYRKSYTGFGLEEIIRELELIVQFEEGKFKGAVTYRGMTEEV